MLQVFHKYKRSFFVIFVVAAVAFVMTGFGLNIAGGRKPTYAVRVNDYEVSIDRFYEERRKLENQYRRIFGQNFDRIFSRSDITQQVVDKIINDALLYDLARQFGMVASNAGVQQMILGSGLFEGGFDERVYRAYLSQLGMTSAQFESLLRRETLSRELAEVIFDISLLSDSELENLIRIKDRSFLVKYIEFDPKSYLSSVEEPSKDELTRYYEENASQYETKPAVLYYYIPYFAKDFEKEVEVLPEDIEMYYSEHQSQFRTPEEVKVRHIQFTFGENDTPEQMASLKEKAEEIRKRALSGEPFEDLVRAYSDDYATRDIGGDLGWLRRGDPRKEIVAAAFKQKGGGVGELVETDSGYEVIYVDAYKPSKVKELAEVQSEIEARLRKEQAPAYARSAAYDFYDEWTKRSGIPLNEFAVRKGKIALVTSDLLESGDDPDGLKGLTKKVIANADLKEQIVEIGDDTVIVGIKEFAPAEVPQLDIVREKVKKDWRKEESYKLARKSAEDVLSALAAGEKIDLEKEAKIVGFKVSKPLKVSQAAPGQGVLGDPSIQQEIFSAYGKGFLPKKVHSVGGKFYVVQVLNVSYPSGRDVAKKMAKLRYSEKIKGGREFLKAILNTLKAESDIKVRDEIL
ncbi:MAG: hypothetical protein D6808_05090 [Candidatus Dadabacteria bacterium]|nr:MAG: hypothetical protein D6808_05090 [Candidatus Dadabacteria bacterium]